MYTRGENLLIQQNQEMQMIYFLDQLTVLSKAVKTVREAIATAIVFLQYLASQEKASPWFIEVEKDDDDYEDYWTETIAVHRVELSDGRALPILCESPSEAWNQIEAWLFEKNDTSTSILRITRDEW